jgi:hypothetical protein
VSGPLPQPDISGPSVRTCRIAGCEDAARLRGFCPPCWGRYLLSRRQEEARLELHALAVRPEVEEGLDGAPALWDAMAVNLAAWRSLPLEERGRERSDWWRALVDTIAEAAGL